MNKLDNLVKKHKFVFCIVQILSILYWLAVLRSTDSYYCPYLLVGSCGIMSTYINMIEDRNFAKDKDRLIIIAFSGLLSLMIAAANYKIFSNVNTPENIDVGSFGFYQKSLFVGMLIGGFFACINLFVYLWDRLKSFYWHREERHRWKAASIYFAGLFSISVVDISIMYACYYPGNLTSDSLYVIKQALYGPYSNHQPYYYTKIVEFFLERGKEWFHNINAAVAVFSIFQIIFMAACISWVIVTLYQMEISWKLIVGCWILYIVMPFHIMYSFTMWKDVMFGGLVVVFIVSVFRIWKKIGNCVALNWLLLIIGGIGTCLFRSNGWLAFFLSFLLFLFLFGEDTNKKRMCMCFAGILGLSIILKYPVLHALGVRQPDTLEKLAVPVQQIARIVRDCDDVREDHIELLSRIVDVDRIPEVYKSGFAAPVKELIREGDQQYLMDHKAVYLKLYLEMSLAHIDKSVEAWIDLTKGYWNGGYSHWKWMDCVDGKEELGLERTVHLQNIKKIIDAYFWLYDSNAFFQIFVSIGFHIWILLALAVLSILRRDKESLFMTIPLLSMAFTLLISTPVYAEFRYIYALFCSIPFLGFTTFFRKKTEECL